MVYRNKRGRFCQKRYRYEEPKDLPETDHSYALDHSQHNTDSDNNNIGTAKNEKPGGPMKMNNFRVAFNFKRNKTKKLKLEEHAGEEDTLELDCESVVDDGELHKQTQSVKHAYTGTDSRKRKSEYRMLEETSNEEEVEFQSIHGLPVNVPFTLQYQSPCARKTLKSKMYVIVEQRVLSYLPVSSMNINVQGDICEHTSEDNVCPFMKDIEEEKMSSWVDIQKVIKQFALNTDQTKNVSSNFPDNSDLSYDPIVIKQEVKDSYFESVEDCMNTTRDTVMCDGSTNDLVMTDDFVIGDNVTVMSDGLPSYSNQLCEVKMENGPIRNTKSEHKIKYISKKVYNKRRKPVKVEETESICQSEQQSSRLRSRNSSINYEQFGDLNDPSDVDVMVSDSEGADNGDKETSTSAGREIKGTSTGKVKRKKQKKKKDPDFDPCEFEPKYKQLASHLKSEGDGIKDENLDWNMEFEKEFANFLPTEEEVNAEARQLFTEKQMLKRMEQEKSRIRVKLSDHADKYTVQEHVSFSMQDRGKEDWEKTMKLLVCSQCKKFRTENEQQMEKHIEEHVNGELTCKECYFHACHLQEMRIHNKKHQNVQIETRLCPICRLRFGDNKAYTEHLSSIHNLHRIVCRICLKAGKQVSFKCNDKLQEHFLEEHKDLMHKCTDCERYFRSRVALTTHSCLAERSNASKAPCEICGTILRKDRIAKHKKDVHFKIRMHPCPHCSFAAKTPCRLRKHIEARHEGVKSLHCDQCTFSCVYEYQLVSHQRTHTGIKPYKCDECPYAAAWNVQLKDHKKLHSNPLGVECKLCGVVVKRGASYSIHMKKEHNESGVDYM